MGHLGRTTVALFDALAMVVLAATAIGAPQGFDRADLVLWGSAAAAAVVALVVGLSGPGFIAWAAIGYVLYAALLASAHSSVVILALAVALMPVAPTPRRSLATGIVVATCVAFATHEIITRTMS